MVFAGLYPEMNQYEELRMHWTSCVLTMRRSLRTGIINRTSALASGAVSWFAS